MSPIKVYDVSFAIPEFGRCLENQATSILPKKPNLQVISTKNNNLSTPL